jgi:FdhD protein
MMRGMASGKHEVEVQRIAADGSHQTVMDAVVTEEPLEIRLGDDPIAVVMRTPGNDMSLAVGFLFSEGILKDPDQVLSVAYCSDTTDDAAGNIVRVIAEGADREAVEAARRQIYASSSCGLCGKTTLDAVRLLTPSLEPLGPLKHAIVARMPEQLREAQTLFDATGGLHAAGLFRTDGELRLVQEDVGRHNACDKILGAMVLREEWPLSGHVLALSGRASFEMVQKAAMAGIGGIVAVSAPSSLAVELAQEHGMTLVGFARHGKMNAYSGEIIP